MYPQNRSHGGGGIPYTHRIGHTADMSYTHTKGNTVGMIYAQSISRVMSISREMIYTSSIDHVAHMYTHSISHTGNI